MDVRCGSFRLQHDIFFGDEPIRHAFGFSNKTGVLRKMRKESRKFRNTGGVLHPQLTVTKLNRRNTTSRHGAFKLGSYANTTNCYKSLKQMGLATFIPFAISMCLVLLSLLLLLALFELLEYDMNFREQKGVVGASS